MKIYLIDDVNVAKQICQLLKLNSECAKLHWSGTIKELPKNVVDSLDTIESFVEAKVYEVCTEKTFVSSLDEDEEAKLMALIRKMPELRSTIGTGVIMVGEESKVVAEVIDEKNICKALSTALASGKNVILF